MDIWNKRLELPFSITPIINEDDLLKTVHIRNEPLSAIDAINRQLAHYPHHVGQIIYIGKIIKGDKWINLSVPKRKK